MNHIKKYICKNCHVRKIAKFSPLFKVRTCYLCKDLIVPEYIPREQYIKYLELYYERKV